MKRSTEKVYVKRIMHVLVHIQKNLDNEMSLEELAKKAHFSQYHFHRIFSGLVGESLQEHIRRLRLERAASCLKYTEKTVTDIAFDAGYQTHEAFSRAFRQAFDSSPSEFRSNNTLVTQIGKTSIHYKDNVQENDITILIGEEKMDVEIKTIEPMRVAFVHHVGPYGQVGIAWEKLCMYLGKDGLLGGQCQFIGICYDDPEVTAPEKIRYDACVTVDENFVPTDEIAVQTIGGGEYAVTTHFGPYEKLGETYSKLYGQWLVQSDREYRSEPGMEFYLNAPDNTEPEDLVTDICIPLKPKK
ncbi:MAG: AraC family transcriptional regulator [Sedimentisphaerales bacterium]|nr:AraC family transcriptional regulator [Sedimentisphaerales bacterium]